MAGTGWPSGGADLPPAGARLRLLQPAAVRLAQRQLPARVRQGAVLLLDVVCRAGLGHRRRRGADGQRRRAVGGRHVQRGGGWRCAAGGETGQTTAVERHCRAAGARPAAR